MSAHRPRFPTIGGYSRATGRTSARLLVTAIALGAIWPAISVLNGAVAIHQLPYYSPTWSTSLKAAAVGLMLSLPEFALTGLMAAFGILGVMKVADGLGWTRYGLEPGRLSAASEVLLVLLSVLLGASLWYPVVVAQPLLGGLLALPAWVLLAMDLLAVGVLSRIAAQPGKAMRLSLLVLVVGIVTPVPSVLRSFVPPSGRPAEMILLGLDSVSHDDTSQLREWVQSKAGTDYEKAVAPALLTNAVWASVLTGQYPSSHGVTQTFQPLDQSSERLLKLARKAGYRTVSRFADQLTCWLGSDGGFDDDLSGPIGWRQLILPIIHDSSVLLPLVRPILPRAGFLASPPNMAGTYSFSLRRDLDELLHTSRSEPTFVAGHTTFMHFSSYPRYMDLSAEEVRRVLASPATAVSDRTFDWKDSDRATDPVAVHTWKRRRLFEEVADAIDRSNALGSGSRIVLFSDHGERIGLDATSVTDPKYHRVLLATFNLPAQSPGSPRSLVDIGHLFGTLEASPSPPKVEFSELRGELWGALVGSAKLHWSGRVFLDPDTLNRAMVPPVVFQPWPAGTPDLTPPTSPARDTRSGRQ